MRESALQRAFHSRADEERFANRLRNPWIRTREMALSRRLAALRPQAADVLEVGCGEGSNLEYLHAQLPGARLAGIDFSQAKIDFARDYLPMAEFQCADAQQLPYADASFDLVFCRDLLHHVDFNRSGVLAEMLRVIRPGGTLAVLESQGLTPLNLLFQLLYPVERGLRHSTAGSLRALAQGHGRVRLEFVECSFLVRAMGFVLGWPAQAHWQWPMHWLYAAARGWERLLEVLLPRGLWTYMLLTIEPSGSGEARP